MFRIEATELIKTFHFCASNIPYNGYKAFSPPDITMTDEKREYKEKVKAEDNGGYKVESEAKDEFGNKVKEKHEVNVD